MNKSLDSYQNNEDKNNTFGDLLLVVNFVVGVTSICANAFVIDTIRSRDELVGSGDMFVLCLAISDLLTGCILTITICNVFVDYLSRTACLLQMCSLQTTLLCSALILSALTTDRYLKIVHPFTHERNCSDWQSHWVCCSLAIFSCIIGFLPFAGVGQTTNASFMICSYLQVIEAGFQAGLIVLMVIPITFSLLLYFWILRLAMSHAVAIAKTTRDRVLSETITLIRLRYNRVLFVMAGMYLALYIPAVMGTLLLRNIPMTYSEFTRSALFHLSSIGVWSTCLINPLIYASKVNIVKERLRVMFGWKGQSTHYDQPRHKAVISHVPQGLIERTVRFGITFMSVKVAAAKPGRVERKTEGSTHSSIPFIVVRDSSLTGSATTEGGISSGVEVKDNGVQQSESCVKVSGAGGENSGVKVIRMEDSGED